MNESGLAYLIDEYSRALVAEEVDITNLAFCKQAAERRRMTLVYAAYRLGMIDGNGPAEARAASEWALLHGRFDVSIGSLEFIRLIGGLPYAKAVENYESALEGLNQHEITLLKSSTTRKLIEAKLDLIRAWLNSGKEA